MKIYEAIFGKFMDSIAATSHYIHSDMIFIWIFHELSFQKAVLWIGGIALSGVPNGL